MLPSLLTQLDIARVVVVDDLFTPQASAYLAAFDPEEAPTISNLPARPSNTDYETHVTAHWGAIPIEEKLALHKQALKKSELDALDVDPTGLSRLVGDKPFRGLTLHEWEQEEQRMLTARGRALILFDVNFAQETGNSADFAGLAPAGRALNSNHDHIIGLLTTRTSVGNEESDAIGWAPRARVQPSKLVVVNKDLIAPDADGSDVARAVEQIRTALQASQLTRLRTRVENALKLGLDRAAQAIGDRSPSVLEDLVFAASLDGGEWEGDTWFRLFATLGLDTARRDVAMDRQARRAIADVRTLLNSRQSDAHEGSRALAEEIQQAECYDSSDYLNQAGLPIANGDIFRTKTGRSFVLVGQPCDLTLRPSGRARNPATATLLPVRQRLDGGADSEPSAYRLPPGSPLGEGDWEVRFRPEFHVSFDVLDLVSLNTDGRASARPPRGTALSPLLPGLRARFLMIEKLIARLSAPLAEIDRLVAEGHIRKDLAKGLRHSLLHFGGPFRATLSATPTPFAFDCQRIGRLSGTYADALLTAHAAARSRTAHAHELTRIVADRAS